MGRGYRIGDFKAVPARAGFAASPPGSGLVDPVVLVDNGEINIIRRWKVTLSCQDPEGNDPTRSGAGLRFTVLAKMENERIVRRCFTTTNQSAVIYAPGRSIRVLALNPNNFELEAHYQIDEFTAGLSDWKDQQFFGGVDALTGETDLSVPPFCDTFEVFSPGAGSPPPRIRGYGPGGVVAYDEVLTVPRSGEIKRIPNLDYTLSPTGAAPQTHIVLYECTG